MGGGLRASWGGGRASWGGGKEEWASRLDALGAAVFRGRFLQQFAALLYKNLLVAWRSRRATAIRLLAPFVFLVLALIINLSLEANNSQQARVRDAPGAEPAPIGGVPPCAADLFIGRRKPCYDFVYTPAGDAEFDSLVQRVMAYNDPPIPPQRVRGFPSRGASDAWLVANGDTALGAVHFARDPRGNVQYTLQSNSTVKYFKGTFQDPTTFFQVPFLNAVAREAARGALLKKAARAGAGAAAPPFAWEPRLVPFPHPFLQTQSMLGGVLAAFLFAALMFGFVSQMTNLVGERESGLRTALRNMGMLDSAYWASWVVFDALMSLAAAALILAFGLVLQFDYFKRNDAGLTLVLFWLFGMAMSSYSYALSVWLKKSQSAVYLGFVVFIVGWVFQTVAIGAALPYSPQYYYSRTNPWGRVFFWVFNLFPWNPLTKGIMDMGAATASRAAPGLRWGQRYSYCQYVPEEALQAPYDTRSEYRDYDCVYPMGQAYHTLLIQWAAYLALAVYCSNVLPNELGARRPPWYFVDPGYWLPRPAARGAALRAVLDQEARRTAMPPPEAGPRESAVAAEEERMRSLLTARAGKAGRGGGGGGGGGDGGGGAMAAELYGLRKVFPGARRGGPLAWLPGCGQRAPDFWAVQGTWLGIEHGQLFCLLGPNGAGKTTTINCLTGVLPFTGGDALIYGEAISSEGGLDRVRPLMGVCPQFDVLWGELSGREHLAIYGHVKGVPFREVRRQAGELLDKVKLTYAGGVRSGSYSGGMKRRLSVAIALLGDPKVVYLDEPTTGMDPISRRYVWDIIQDAKAGRAIVLTTHSMEEADVLGDRIGIMARGRLRAVGSAIRLKQKFGAGYVLSVSPAGAARSFADLAEARKTAARADAIKEHVRCELGLEPEEETRAYITYLVDKGLEGRLQGFLADLEERAGELGVGDVQLSLTSLEDVFLAIARQAELEHAAASGSTLVEVDLPNGSAVMVGLGEEEATDPADGSRWFVKWSQDDTGRLVVLGVDAWGGPSRGASRAASRAAASRAASRGPSPGPPYGGGGGSGGGGGGARNGGGAQHAPRSTVSTGSGGGFDGGPGPGWGRPPAGPRGRARQLLSSLGGALPFGRAPVAAAAALEHDGAPHVPSVETPGRWDCASQTVERYDSEGGFFPPSEGGGGGGGGGYPPGGYR